MVQIKIPRPDPVVPRTKLDVIPNPSKLGFETMTDMIQLYKRLPFHFTLLHSTTGSARLLP
uniref:Uncharacterized protein n=1 Tax=Oryza nivara TaxID=4536 RepID=A0A0E0FGJ5_ORYNI